MEFTQQEVLAMLEELDRNKWNVRQMTALRKEGCLPPLRRKTKPGTKKPLYVWDETDLDQIIEVYDWWDYCDGDRVTLTLLLWLEGYDIPLDPLRKFYIQTIEMYLQRLTRGETDVDEILDRVSEIVFMYMRKMKYTPGLAEQRKKMETQQHVSMEQMEMFFEAALRALLVPDQEYDADKELENILPDNPEDEGLYIEAEDIAAILRDIFSLPNLRDIVISAAIEQWEQAREDFNTICRLFTEFRKLPAHPNSSPFPEELITHLTLFAAVWLLVPLLSARCRGYGQIIDIVFKKIHELLADPAVQERILMRQNSQPIP